MEPKILTVQTSRGELQYYRNFKTSEGAIVMKNAQTLSRYWELYNQHPSTDGRACWYAFGQDQFDKAVAAKKNAGLLSDNDKVVAGGAGLYGTCEGIRGLLQFYDERNKVIAAECDPQEVYFTEYNNHECMYAWDGDLGAVQVILDIWGKDVAERLVRFSDCYSVDEICKM